MGITTDVHDLEKCVNFITGAERVAQILTETPTERAALAKACGRSSVHNLEAEDLRDPSFQASAFTGVKMAGIDRVFEW